MRLRVLLATFMLAGSTAFAQGVDIAAVVNDKIISTLDLNERVDIVMATTGIPDTQENRSRLMPQILRQLVDEQLQRDEGDRSGITITPERINEGIAQIERQSNKPEGSLREFLKMRGLSLTSFEDQVRAQMAWSEVVLKKIRPRIRISDQEIARYVARKSGPGKTTAATPDKPVVQRESREVKIAVLQLPVDSPQNDAKIRKIALKLSDAIHGGAQFEAVAAQFSSSTGVTRAEPFWVETSQLDPIILKGITGQPKGGVSTPVRTASGYQIIKVVDFRLPKNAPKPAPDKTEEKAETADTSVQEPRAELAYKQILMNMKPDAEEKEAELLLKLSREVARNPGKCEENSMAGAAGLEDVDFTVTLNRATSDDMPEKLRELLMMMSVGSVSQPVVTPQGIRLFMLCERIELAADNTPGKAESSSNAIRQAIYAQKLELEAQKYMRDLRRSAFVETRIQ